MLFARAQLIGFMLLVSAVAAIADDGAPVWRPITPEELRMTTPKVEPEADAEALFWEVWIDDKKLLSVYYEHYVRVKIFTKSGQEKFSKFDIPFVKGKKIENIAARVIRPDGTITVLDPKDIFEREIVKAGKIKVKAKSFAIPGIEPGVIVEYKYRETFKDSTANGVRLFFQRDIPVQSIAYHIRPPGGYKPIPRFFNMPDTPFIEDPAEKGFFVASIKDVPAYQPEPNMPPEDEVKRWAFLSYTEKTSVWPWVHGRFSPLLQEYAKPTKLIKAKASELTAGANNDEAKLRNIYDYVRTAVKNIDFDRLGTDDEREDIKFDHAEDALKKGMGNSAYIQLLFASLAKAAGYEPWIVLSGDRREAFFSPEKYPYSNFIRPSAIAIKVGSEWKYFCPAIPYVPFGLTPWNDEGLIAMLVGENSFIWHKVPISVPGRSPASRTADLSLAADGTLEGKVKLEFSGHQAISRRRDLYLDSDAKRKESIEAELKQRISTAEITGIMVENFDDPEKPLIYSLNIRIPNYAQRTGQRIFFQPGFFEFGASPVFSASTRRHNIHFSYPWSEIDEISIKLPAGFDLDNAEQPAPISDPNKITSLKLVMSIDRSANLMRLRREFHFGGSGNILFPATTYAVLKRLFDNFHKADGHMLSLRERK